ncbi:universal stress protein [Halovenus sp. WSH3]|uniref:Universal stress protein n=1 Tax=Halovenus carboxidivorans TaxID=2692199 RepID=A0A6B0T5P9_9EURY|nr:universal stress protein [Halovenus carboxidivorans]MXR50883.1 universal stress protein [Halovenus carboxidivorans]
MVFLVPYDGSRVAQAALDRAVEHGEALDEEVVAVSFVPTGSEYAQRRKWIEPSEEFAADSARERLQEKIEETTDSAERTFDETGASGVHEGLAERIRQVADDVGATVLFVGTEDSEDDDIATPFGPISPDGKYDVHLVRSY